MRSTTFLCFATIQYRHKGQRSLSISRHKHSNRATPLLLPGQEIKIPRVELFLRLKGIDDPSMLAPARTGRPAKVDRPPLIAKSKRLRLQADITGLVSEQTNVARSRGCSYST